jgi:hypothetical protein
MSRPHEDRQRHTLVHHRPGGLPMTFRNGNWLAIGVGRVKATRSDACVAAYETLVEEAQTFNAHADSAVILTSYNGRRVVTMVKVRGQTAFVTSRRLGTIITASRSIGPLRNRCHSASTRSSRRSATR